MNISIKNTIKLSSIKTFLNLHSYTYTLFDQGTRHRWLLLRELHGALVEAGEPSAGCPAARGGQGGAPAARPTRLGAAQRVCSAVAQGARTSLYGGKDFCGPFFCS